ncbi:hypothetical protein EON68_01400 [archaeon]|nr:MAG: hypothetical protein EON68_01400 [archaeon]
MAVDDWASPTSPSSEAPLSPPSVWDPEAWPAPSYTAASSASVLSCVTLVTRRHASLAAARGLFALALLATRSTSASSASGSFTTTRVPRAPAEEPMPPAAVGGARAEADDADVERVASSASANRPRAVEACRPSIRCRRTASCRRRPRWARPRLAFIPRWGASAVA